MAKKQPGTALQTGKRDNQISSPGGMQSYFLRNIPVWNPPAWQQADYWRAFVEKQPIAAICRDTIANYLNSLDWAVVARDSSKHDELKPRIKHYTKLFERGNAYYWDIDFSSQIEWFVKDLFTLPFGTASEIGRLDDDPGGRVVWIRPLDAGSLAPTLNFDFPVVQSAPGTGLQPIYFPREYISRVYLSPRTELRREGWGYAPPERIMRALEMLSTGDNYYWQLLLNTPEAGVLDLGDMEKQSALDWIASVADLMYGVSPLKIPVLYEHTTQAKFIPFGKDPANILYDSVTMRYAAILAAGYGLTLSDIGFPTSSSGGDTLAGTIRNERVSKSSGKALAKKKWEAYANRILDPALKFIWIDYDDERNVSKGRARLASAQAAQILIANRSFKPSEMRRQYLADGLITIDVPEEIDENDPEFQALQQTKTVGNATKELNGKVQPSQGGQGEVIPQQIIQRSMRDAKLTLTKAVKESNEILLSLVNQVKSNLAPEEIGIWEEYVDSYLTGKSDIEEEELKGVLDSVQKQAKAVISTQRWVEDISNAITDKILEVETNVQRDKALYRAEKKAEEDFVAGEENQIEDFEVDLSMHRENLHGVILENLTTLLANYCILVSKSHLFAGKLEVDATERVSKNISISGEIAGEVLQQFARIVNSVYEIGLNYIERIQQDAVN